MWTGKFRIRIEKRNAEKIGKASQVVSLGQLLRRWKYPKEATSSIWWLPVWPKLTLSQVSHGSINSIGPKRTRHPRMMGG